jgi:hypothetical protein
LKEYRLTKNDVLGIPVVREQVNYRTWMELVARSVLEDISKRKHGIEIYKTFFARPATSSDDEDTAEEQEAAEGGVIYFSDYSTGSEEFSDYDN